MGGGFVPPRQVNGFGGNYVKELLKPATLARLDALAKDDAVVVVQVLHDGWCASYRGRPCDCSPELVIGLEPAPVEDAP